MCTRVKLLYLLLLITFAFQLPAAGQSEENGVFKARREKAIERSGGGAILIPGILRTPYGHNDKSTAEFFYYLTGWEPSGAIMLLEPGKYTLFVVPSSPVVSAYTGRTPGIREAMDEFGADTAIAFSQIRKTLPGLLARYDTIWYLSPSKLMYETITPLLPAGKNPVIMDARLILNDLRVIKDNFVISMLKKAINVTGDALVQAMKLCAPGRWEYELEAAIDHTFRSKGCDGPGFTTIVGSGINSTILHYETNNMQMKDGDVVVMDVGAQYHGYTADITRTIPVSGKFTEEQLAIYNLVLKAEKEAIKLMIPGEKTLAPHDRASEIVMSGLYRLGLVTDTTSHWQKDLYVLYNASHHIGLNVHDLDSYLLTRDSKSVFRPGMVVTIEPGIYFSPELLSNLKQKYAGTPVEKEVEAFIIRTGPVLEKYLNIGIRIEDDILITEQGYINLSEATPKEPHEIERLMKKKGYYR